MQIMPKIPRTLERRAVDGHVPIRCGCGTSFLWERRRGREVRCPTCLKIETLPIDGAAFDTSNVPTPE